MGFPPKVDGLSRHVYLLSKYQVKAGHVVTVLQPNCPGFGEGGLVVRRVPNRGLGGGRITRSSKVHFGVCATLEVARRWRDGGLDLLHLHGDFYEAAIVGLIARRLLSLRTVLTIHGGVSRRSLYRLAAPPVLNQMHQVIAVSPGVRAELIELGVRDEKVSVISSGVEWNSYCPLGVGEWRRVREQFGLPADATIAVFVGRLHPVKGLGTLVDTARLLAARSKVHFAIVGDGPLRTALQQQAAELGNLSVLGLLDSSAVADVLRAVDVFFLPSIDLPDQREGIPTALLEAMAAGLPVVVSDAGGAKYIVEDGVNGLVVPQGDPRSMACAIESLMGDAKRRRRMGEINREMAWRRDWAVIAEEVDKVYSRAMRIEG